MTTATARPEAHDAEINLNEPEIRSATQRVAEQAHSKIDQAAEMAESVEQTAREKAAEASQRAREAGVKTQAAGEEALTKAQNAIEQNPLAAAGAAFAIGFVVSALLRR